MYNPNQTIRQAHAIFAIKIDKSYHAKEGCKILTLLCFHTNKAKQRIFRQLTTINAESIIHEVFLRSEIIALCHLETVRKR